MDDVTLPHPMQVNIPREALERDYHNVLVDRCVSPLWHFRLNLHKSTRIAPGGEMPPSRTAPFQTLALFQRPEPLADLEVFGLDLPVDVDPADWLALWLEQHGLKVESSTPVPTPRGVFGDCVCTWDTPDGPFAGRFVAMRWGRRLFLIAQRTPRANYEALADDYFAALSSFAPVEIDERALNAEGRQTLTLPTPIAASVSLPVSYAATMELSQEQVTAFSAEQQAIAELPDDPTFGKLNFLLGDLSLADHPGKAAALYFKPLMENPITLGGDEFNEEPAPAPFLQSWLLTAPAVINQPDGQQVPYEVRCRVMAHGRAWFVAGVLGPARHIAPIAWMRNKRALDLVCTTVNIT